MSLALAGPGDVRVSVDPGWLSSPARVYPVSVDPTLNVTSTTSGDDDVYAQQNNPTVNYNGGAQYDSSVGAYVDVVGYPSYPSVQAYTYQHFNVSSLAGKVIMGAQWKDWVYAESAAGAPFTIWPTGGAWSAGSVTWNSLPGHLGSPQISASAPSSGNWAYVGCSNSPCYSDPLTQVVQGWANGSTVNNGLALDTAGQNSWVKLGADENGGQNFVPSLFVTYDTQSPPSTQVSPANGSTSMSATPTFATSAVTDADGYGVSYWFRVSSNRDGVSGQVVNSGWISATTWTPPAGTLQDGTTYYWQAYTWDGVGPNAIPAPSRWDLKVNLRLGQQAATPTDTEGPFGVDLANGNVFYSQEGPSFSTVGGALAMRYSYNSLAPSPYGLTGHYFANCDYQTWDPTSQPTAVRSDPVINFNWNTVGPMPSVGQTNFCVRWTGYLTVPYAQNNWFVGGYSDDGLRIWVNGAQVLNKWAPQANTLNWSSQMSLPAGAVPITVDYFQAGGGANIELQESGPVNYGDIPPSWLSSAAPDMPQGWAASMGGDTTLSYRSATVGADDITLTGPDGDTTDFTRTGSGWAPPPGVDDVLSTDSAGRVTVDGADGIIYTFNGSGQLTAAVTATDDAHRAAAQYGYIANTTGPSQLSSITDPVSGRAMTLRYASDPTAANPPCASPPTGFTYPPAGSLCEVDYWDGTATHLSYNANGQLAEISDPGGSITDFAYASGGQMATIRSSLAADEVNAGLRSDDATVRTTVTYNSTAQAATIVEPAPASGAAQPEHDYSYGAGQTQVKTAGLVMPNGYSRQVTYNSAGQTVTDTDDNGLTTSYVHDNADNLLSTIEPTGLETATTYSQIWRNVNGLVDDLPTDSYGAAPSSCFAPAPNGVTLTGCSAAVPHATTRYDENSHGLQMAYYNSPDLSGMPVAHDQRSNTGAAGVQTNWGDAAPVPGITNPSSFSTSATGYLSVPTSGTWGFQVYSRGGARLFIDDTDFSDDWSNYNVAGTNSPAFTLALAAGVKYRVRVDFTCASNSTGTCNSGNNTAGMTLLWTPPGGAQTAAPLSAFTPGYGLATSATDADGHTTATQYPKPWLATVGATVTDPGGLNLRTVTTSEDPATGYGRPLAKTLPRQTYTGAVIADGPSGYWPLDDPRGSSTIQAAAGSIGAGTPNAAVSLAAATTGLIDDPDQTPAFDGATSSVQLPNVAADQLPATSAYTLEGWVKTTSTAPQVVISDIASTPGGCSTCQGSELWLYQGKLYYYEIHNQGAGDEIMLNGAKTLSDGNWHHVAATTNGNAKASGVTLYVDGQPDTITVDADALAGSTVSGAGLTIGSRQTQANNFFNGDLADIAVYPSALSAAQVAAHYQAATNQALGATDVYYAPAGLPVTTACAGTAGVVQAGLLEAGTSPAGIGGPTVVHQYAYDARGRVVATRVATDANWSCTVYDTRGRVTQQTNSTGGTDNFNYATPGTIVETYTDSSGANRSVTTVVDLLGRTTSYTDPSGTITTTGYDQAGRTTATTRQLPGQAGATPVLAETYAASGVNADRLTSETDSVSSTPQTITYGYDTYGRMTTVTRPAGIATTTYGYDPNAGYQNSITHAAGSSSLAYSYVDSPAGKEQSETVTGVIARTRNFTYDQAGRLTGAVQTGGAQPGTRSYAYDADTNRCATATTCNSTYSYDSADRLTASPQATAYTYNPHGAVTAETPAAGKQVARTIGYDGWDHTTSLDDGTNTTTDTVDPTGRVLREQVTADSTHQATSDTTYGYADDTDSPAWTQPTAGGPTTTYIQTAGGLIIDTAGQPSYQLADNQGTIAATSTTTNPLTAAPESDEFGVPSGPQGQLGWLGTHERFSIDTSTGIIRMGQRLYDPTLGRFLEVDPLEGGSANAYDYVSQDPLNNLDTNGTVEISLDDGGGGGPLGGEGGGNPGEDEAPESRPRPRPNTKGLEKQLRAHQAKLQEYVNSPLAQDNKGILRRAIDDGEFERAGNIIRTRIENLKRQIAEFERQIRRAHR